MDPSESKQVRPQQLFYNRPSFHSELSRIYLSDQDVTKLLCLVLTIPTATAAVKGMQVYWRGSKTYLTNGFYCIEFLLFYFETVMFTTIGKHAGLCYLMICFHYRALFSMFTVESSSVRSLRYTTGFKQWLYATMYSGLYKDNICWVNIHGFTVRNPIFCRHTDIGLESKGVRISYFS